jgi:aspartyl/asparaginyl beta-hydroxylase
MSMSSVELAPWLERIHARRASVRSEVAPLHVNLFRLTSGVLSAPRRVFRGVPRQRPEAPDLQLPWLPVWPGLTAQPFHNPQDFPWVRALEDSVSEIRDELHQVERNFGRAAYDSDRNIKTWRTFYFYLNGRPVPEHLSACPKTSALLAQIPLNGLHVCFSAIEPGGVLQPHTGPTNVSLTAHLGLEGCEGSALWAAGQRQPYREGKVLVFDDSFVHYVQHEGSQKRYTLMVTFWHPDLNAAERGLLSVLLKSAPKSALEAPNPIDLRKA